MVQLIAISLTVCGLTSHQISLLSQAHTLDADKPPKVSLDGCLEHCATVTARLTMSGAGGSGKSVLINTISSVLQKYSDVPTLCMSADQLGRLLRLLTVGVSLQSVTVTSFPPSQIQPADM